ncbi:MAG: hypothetical protein ACOC2Y_00165 [Spirochaetota bacterium]
MKRLFLATAVLLCTAVLSAQSMSLALFAGAGVSGSAFEGGDFTGEPPFHCDDG